jgi:pimeloyl-ACP methyl ester carboxylesterase
MARVFAWLRPNDLVWLFVANNWSAGTPAFDILYWNSDTTRLPAEFHADLLRMFMENPLMSPGRITALGTPIDMSKVKVPAYVVAGVTDHITPWQACYQSRNILRGKIDFVLSSSGHIQSIVNPPTNPKAKYFHVAGGRCRNVAGRCGVNMPAAGGSTGASGTPQHARAKCPPLVPWQRAASCRRSRTGALRSPEMSTPQVEFIEVDGVNLRVATQSGKGGLPLLLFNGIGANLELCFPFMEAMPEKEIVIFDVPGVGRSEMSWRPRRFSGLARLANKLLDRLGYQKVDVIGVSWGGALAQQLHASIRNDAGAHPVASRPAPSCPRSPIGTVRMVTPRRYCRRPCRRSRAKSTARAPRPVLGVRALPRANHSATVHGIRLSAAGGHGVDQHSLAASHSPTDAGHGGVGGSPRAADQRAHHFHAHPHQPAVHPSRGRPPLHAPLHR